MIVLLELLWAFIQVGAMAFGGGYAALPLIESIIVNQNGWLNMTEMIDVVTISQMTPGPIAINAATFVGTKIAGIPGAIVATVGTVLPQSILMFTLGYFMFGGKKIVFLEKILKGLRPGIVGLIGSAALSMFLSALFPSGTFSEIDWIATVGFVIGFVLYSRKVDMMKLIALGAVMGIVMGALSLWI